MYGLPHNPNGCPHDTRGPPRGKTFTVLDAIVNPFTTDSFFENAPKFEEISMRNAAPRQHMTQQQQWWRSRSYLLLLQVSHGLSESLAVSRSLYPPHYVFTRRARHE